MKAKVPPDGYPLPKLVVGFAVMLSVFFLYLGTLAPTVLGFEPPVVFDSAMLQTASYTLGVAHPTGYSTYLMLTHLFTYLPFGDVAYRVNLASAVFGSVAVFFVYLISLRLSGRIAASALGALAFGVSATFWSQAVIAEVYTLNALFVSAIIFTLLVWRDTRRQLFLLLACFLAGLSLTHHLTSALLVPAGIGFVMFSGTLGMSVRKFVPRGLVLFLLGLIPYVYFPLRAMMNAPLNETDPSTPGRFLMLVTGGGFIFRDDVPRNEVSGGEPSPGTSFVDAAFVRVPDYFGYVFGQFPLLLFAVAGVGILYFMLRDRATATLLGVVLVGALLHGLVYGYEDYFLFAIPAYLVLGVCISVGASTLADVVASRIPENYGKSAAFGIPAILLAVSLIWIPGTLAVQDRSDDLSGRRTIEAVSNHAEPGSTVLHHRSPLWYMVLVEGRRRDLTLVDPFRTSFQRHTDIVWPDDLSSAESERIYGTGDPTGVETATRVSESGAVYILGREFEDGTADVSDFREAGFRVVEVDGDGNLYELVPQ